MRLNLDEFLSKDSPQRLAGQTQTFVLHSVLVHAGDVGGGHYYAYIRPSVDGNYSDCHDTDPNAIAAGTEQQHDEDDLKKDKPIHLSAVLQSWYKFNDEQVLSVDPREAVDECFGQKLSPFVDEPFIGSMSSAYMLVYILESRAKNEIMKEVESQDIPTDLVHRLNMEEYKKRVAEVIHKIKRTMLRVSYITEYDLLTFTKYSKDYDLCMDSNVMDLPCADMTSGYTTLGLLVLISQQMNIPAYKLRLWSVYKNNNSCYRIARPLVISANQLIKKNDTEMVFVEILEKEYLEASLRDSNTKQVLHKEEVQYHQFSLKYNETMRAIKETFYQFICVLFYKHVLLHEVDSNINIFEEIIAKAQNHPDIRAYIETAQQHFEAVLLSSKNGAGTNSLPRVSSNASSMEGNIDNINAVRQLHKNIINSDLKPLFTYCDIGSSYYKSFSLFFRDIYNSGVDNFNKRLASAEEEYLNNLKRNYLVYTTHVYNAQVATSTNYVPYNPYQLPPPNNMACPPDYPDNTSLLVYRVYDPYKKLNFDYSRLLMEKNPAHISLTKSLRKLQVTIEYYQDKIIELQNTDTNTTNSSNEEELKRALKLKEFERALYDHNNECNNKKIELEQLYHQMESMIKKLKRCPVKYVCYYRFRAYQQTQTYVHGIRYMFSQLHYNLAPITLNSPPLEMPWLKLTETMLDKEIAKLRVWRQHSICDVKDMTQFEIKTQPNISLQQLGITGDIFVCDPVYTDSDMNVDSEESSSALAADTDTGHNTVTALGMIQQQYISQKSPSVAVAVKTVHPSSVQNYYTNLTYEMSIQFKPFSELDKVMYVDHVLYTSHLRRQRQMLNKSPYKKRLKPLESSFDSVGIHNNNNNNNVSAKSPTTPMRNNLTGTTTTKAAAGVTVATAGSKRLRSAAATGTTDNSHNNNDNDEISNMEDDCDEDVDDDVDNTSITPDQHLGPATTGAVYTDKNTTYSLNPTATNNNNDDDSNDDDKSEDSNSDYDTSSVHTDSTGSEALSGEFVETIQIQQPLSTLFHRLWRVMGVDSPLHIILYIHFNKNSIVILYDYNPQTTIMDILKPFLSNTNSLDEKFAISYRYCPYRHHNTTLVTNTNTLSHNLLRGGTPSLPATASGDNDSVTDLNYTSLPYIDDRDVFRHFEIFICDARLKYWRKLYLAYLCQFPSTTTAVTTAAVGSSPSQQPPPSLQECLLASLLPVTRSPLYSPDTTTGIDTEHWKDDLFYANRQRLIADFIAKYSNYHSFIAPLDASIINNTTSVNNNNNDSNNNTNNTNTELPGSSFEASQDMDKITATLSYLFHVLQWPLNSSSLTEYFSDLDIRFLMTDRVYLKVPKDLKMDIVIQQSLREVVGLPLNINADGKLASTTNIMKDIHLFGLSPLLLQIKPAVSNYNFNPWWSHSTTSTTANITNITNIDSTEEEEEEGESMIESKVDDLEIVSESEKLPPSSTSNNNKGKGKLPITETEYSSSSSQQLKVLRWTTRDSLSQIELEESMQYFVSEDLHRYNTNTDTHISLNNEHEVIDITDEDTNMQPSDINVKTSKSTDTTSALFPLSIYNIKFSKIIGIAPYQNTVDTACMNTWTEALTATKSVLKEQLGLQHLSHSDLYWMSDAHPAIRSMPVNVFMYTLNVDGESEPWMLSDTYCPFLSYVTQLDTYDSLCQRLETGMYPQRIVYMIFNYYYLLLQ